EAQSLNVLYGDYQILWDVSFRAPAGEVIAILGPNGSGKSTLMNTLSGLLRSRTGAISFRGARIDGLPPHKIVGQGLAHVLERGITIVFIEQNVELALRMAHRGYILESGRAILEGPSADLLASTEVKRIFLGH